MKSKLDHALSLAKKGYQVFPIKENQKTPLTQNGFKDATTAEGKLRAWWNRWPEANIGIATGPASNLFVIDVDCKAADGKTSYHKLSEKHSIGQAPMVGTPSGGYHLWFEYPDGVELRNTAGLLGPGIDTRASGGYVLAPGSVLENGSYKYLGKQFTKPSLPDSLIERLTKPRQSPPAPSPSGNGQKIPEGRRDTYLTSLAGTLQARGLADGAILAALKAENELHCDPPLPPAEVEKVARSVSRYEKGDVSRGTSNVETTDNVEQDDILVTIDDILAEEVNQTWLFKDYLLCQQQLVELFGDPGAGKSLIALDMALCLATATPWAGITPEIPGAVVYVYAEGRQNLKKRIQAWALHRKISIDDISKGCPFFATKGALQIGGRDWKGGEDDATRLIQKIDYFADQHGPPKLFLVDTVDRNMIGDENNTFDMRNFIQSIDFNIKQRYESNTIVVHHPGHDNKERSRGASNLKGALDAQFMVTRDDQNVITLATGIKPPKDYDPPPPKSFKMIRLEMTTKDRDKNYSSVTVEYLGDEFKSKTLIKPKRGRWADKALGILVDKHDSKCLYSIWRASCHEAGMTRQQFYDAKASLEKRMDIIIVNGVVSTGND